MNDIIELINAVDILNDELFLGSGDTEGMVFSVELFSYGWGVKFSTEILLSSEDGQWTNDENNFRRPVVELLQELFYSYTRRVGAFQLKPNLNLDLNLNPEPDGE